MQLQDVLCFVGVTGLPGAGKGAFIDLLRPLLSEQSVATYYYSLSDELRAEAKRRGLAIERPVLRAIANELRHERGAGVLSLLVTRKMRQELQPLPEGSSVAVIVDAIRNPEEVTTLREELAPRFTLVAIEAPLDILVERIAKRARFDEPEEFVEQKEAARRMILGESGKDEPAHGHNIKQCIAMADWRLDNADSLATLRRQTQRVVEAILARRPG